jgi:hypothetical protein
MEMSQMSFARMRVQQCKFDLSFYHLSDTSILLATCVSFTRARERQKRQAGDGGPHRFLAS